LAKSPAWALCKEEMKDQSKRALSESIKAAKANVKPDFYLGVYDITERIMIYLPEIVLDKIEREEEDYERSTKA